MTNRERYKRAASYINPKKPFSAEEIMERAEKTGEEKKTNNTAIKRMLIAACVVLSFMIVLPTVAYAADLGGFRQTVKLWLYGQRSDVTVEQIGDGKFRMTYPDGRQVEWESSWVRDGGTYGNTLENLIASMEDEYDVFSTDTGIWLCYHDKRVDITDMIIAYDAATVQLEGYYFTVIFETEEIHEIYRSPDDYNWSALPDNYSLTNEPTASDDDFVPDADTVLLDGNVKEGELVYFGKYPQSGRQFEPVKWRVLEVRGGCALLISDMIIDAKPFDNRLFGISYGENETTSWADSSLRGWLNNWFYNRAFSADERSRLLTTVNKNTGEADTKDHVFLLSADEVERYFGAPPTEQNGTAVYSERRAKPTAYALDRRCCLEDGEQSFGSWWLRAPVSENGYVPFVTGHGQTDPEGAYFLFFEHYGVRPAIWVSVSD